MDAKTKAKLKADLESLEERRKAIETELEMMADAPEEKVVRRAFFNSLNPAGQMEFVKAGGRIID